MREKEMRGKRREEVQDERDPMRGQGVRKVGKGENERKKRKLAEKKEMR